MKTRRRYVYSLLGKKVFLWMLGGAVAAASIAYIELLFTFVLQLLLKTLDLLPVNQELVGPFAKYSDNLDKLDVLTIFCIIGVLKAICQYLVAQSAVVVKETVTARFRQTALYNLLGVSDAKYLPSSEINFRLTEIHPKAAGFCSQLAVVIPRTLQVLGLIAIAVYLSPKNVLYSFLAVGIVGTFLTYANKKIRKTSANTMPEYEGLLRGVQRVSRSWLIIKVFRTSAREYNNLSSNNFSYTKLSTNAYTWANVALTLPSLCSIPVFIFLISVHESTGPREGLLFVSFLYILMRIVQMLSELVRMFSMLNLTYPHFLKAVDQLSESNESELKEALYKFSKEDFSTRASETDRNKQHLSSSPILEVKNLSFRYDDLSNDVLSDISFKINPGEQFAIIGESGSGKSTLLSILLGIFAPKAGTVKINGLTPSEFLELYSDQVGYVGVDPFIIDGSIRENLLYGLNAEPSDEEIWEVLGRAHIREEIKQLPNALDHHVQENGDGLSSGQKQRLSIARSLLRKPKLLILDEVTSNLDVDTEIEITEVIKEMKGNCTTIIVSHRQGIIKYADQLLNLN